MHQQLARLVPGAAHLAQLAVGLVQRGPPGTVASALARGDLGLRDAALWNLHLHGDPALGDLHLQGGHILGKIFFLLLQGWRLDVTLDALERRVDDVLRDVCLEAALLVSVGAGHGRTMSWGGG
ncbi:hypothetical protein ACN28I_35575 [Archangium gephyra]|uniref:hypothetical protein n=1 Tax=Archangium gephyra TaxID=48 RepID=UPI003B7C89FB